MCCMSSESSSLPGRIRYTEKLLTSFSPSNTAKSSTPLFTEFSKMDICQDNYQATRCRYMYQHAATYEYYSYCSHCPPVLDYIYASPIRFQNDDHTRRRLYRRWTVTVPSSRPTSVRYWLWVVCPLYERNLLPIPRIFKFPSQLFRLLPTK